jgi:hypothetical protein
MFEVAEVRPSRSSQKHIGPAITRQPLSDLYSAYLPIRAYNN